jgi:1-acyl-sn-glycerol-3-phosphate acyltransferase
LLAAVGVLRGGGLIGVFPEGTRGSGDVLNAEQGAAWLVRQSGALVQPIAVRGTKRPEGSGRRFRPVLDVLAGKPFELSVGRGRAGLEAGTEQIRVALADLVGELDRMRDLR